MWLVPAIISVKLHVAAACSSLAGNVLIHAGSHHSTIADIII